MKLIELPVHNGYTVWVNPDKVQYVKKHSSDTDACYVIFGNNEEDSSLCIGMSARDTAILLQGGEFCDCCLDYELDCAHEDGQTICKDCYPDWSSDDPPENKPPLSVEVLDDAISRMQDL